MKATKFLPAAKTPTESNPKSAPANLQAPLPSFENPEDESLDKRATRITSVLLNIPFYRDSYTRWGINE
jgi:hypothetical protein